jgi:predicted ABC-type transport system involved in lysophospholipase L1 biosynthesis ATPase subunit
VTLLELREVTKHLQDGVRPVVVLDRVSLEVEQGDVVGIFGERQAGKSTLLKVMAGVEPPDSGVATFGGRDIARLSVDARVGLWRHRGIALVRCDWRPVRSNQPVVEHVAMPLVSGGVTLAEGEALARCALDRVGALPWAHLSTDRLSLDERIRVELARAVVREPRLLLVDEPAVLVGSSASRELYALLRALAKEAGMALVIASEDATPLAGVQRAMRISDGRVRSTDSRRRVVAFPERRSRGSGSRAS